MIRDKNTQIVDITHCPLFCDILSHAKTRDEREEIYENNYYSLQLVSYELEKYRKLEEQLGCPLDVFVKALKNGIYHDNKFEYPVFILDKDNFKTKNYHLLVKGTVVYLKDYKNTWWLKEDRSE